MSSHVVFASMLAVMLSPYDQTSTLIVQVDPVRPDEAYTEDCMR